MSALDLELGPIVALSKVRGSPRVSRPMPSDSMRSAMRGVSIMLYR